MGGNAEKIGHSRPRRGQPYGPTGCHPSPGTAVNEGGSVGAGCTAAEGGSNPGGKNTGRVGTG